MKLPHDLEAQAHSITVTWFRATLNEDATFGGTLGAAPAGLSGWARPTGASWGNFTPSSGGWWPSSFNINTSRVTIDFEDYVQQTYVLPDSYWSTFHKEEDFDDE